MAPVTPRMRRITLTAPEFADLGIEEPGEIITLGWAEPGEELVLPRAGLALPARQARAALAQLHGAPAPPRPGGDRRRLRPARRPRARSRLGQPRAGRRSRRIRRAAHHWCDNGGADWSVLVADETGLPALLAILETLPAGHRAVALVEVADEEERQPVQTDADADLRWLVRGRAALADAVRELELPWGRGPCGAAASRVMRAVRDELRRRREVGSCTCSGTGGAARAPSAPARRSPRARGPRPARRT